MSNVMLDLETLGNGANSVIIAIGAVKFDADGLGEEFYEVVDAETCVRMGMQMDTSTVMWWMKQSDEARAAFDRVGSNIFGVLARFSAFCGDSKVWGNGASFDNTILSNAYRKTGVEQPWKFWNDRCYRTMKSLYPQVKIARQGTYHNALDDAKSQASHLIAISKVANFSL